MIITSELATRIANEAGLTQMGVRPSLGRYVKAAWGRRSFIWNLSASRAYARNQGSYLGQAWQIIDPFLDAAVFVIIFGFVLRVDRGLNNAAAFITIGVFVYSLFSRIVLRGAGSITSQTTLIRSHKFPRCVIPLASAITELVLYLPAMVVMIIITWLVGHLPGAYWLQPVQPRPTWLLVPLVSLLVAVFSTGVSLILARVCSRAPDVENVLPFFISLGRFASGVMFSVVARLGPNSHTWWGRIVEWQPVSVYLQLMRAVFGNEPEIRITDGLWTAAVLYAVLAFVIGFIIFWRGEERYGRA